MTVRDNDFIDCNALGGDAFVTIGVAGWGADAPKIHGRISFENNRFSGVTGRRYAVSGVSEFSERREKPQFVFLGDSITDPAHIGCTANYWEFLAEDLGVTPLVYGVNGHQMIHLDGQAQKFAAEHPEGADAIFVFAGTNDYNSGVPLGEWFSETMEKTNHNGKEVERKRRAFVYDDATFKGRINILMRRLRTEWASTPVYLLTPIHRGYATFGPTNVQPDESFSNGLGLYIDDYVAAVKEAGNVWAATVIDINAESGLFPLFPEHAPFFHDGKTDMLHPSAAGHRRIADAIERHMPRV
ncbi:MAG: SGNH/GDSL hydrolase family protein [Kiritimatiellae bacterium]|nr:SGNH/GDSL hydrolase family protein [Kiritimatiellia bacterium]